MEENRMDMLLRDITIADLATLFRESPTASPVPYLFDAEAKVRARRWAEINGIWDRLAAALETPLPPAVRWSVGESFSRTGERGPSERQVGLWRAALRDAVLALWLDHPAADLDRLQDILWTFTEMATWVLPAHRGRVIDLGAADTAADLAEAVHLFGPRLAPDVVAQVRKAVAARVFEPLGDFARADFWWTARHNWNHVCNGSIVRAALYLLDDAAQLAALVHAPLQRMTYGLDGFTDDGGCVEGPGYWEYGFGHFVRAADALAFRTGGAINLLDDEKVARICRYPVAAHIAGPFRATFGDANHGYLAAETPLRINRFHSVPELYALCETHPDGTLRLRALHELALYRGERAPAPDGRDAWLPDMGLVKLRSRPGTDQVTVVAIAGNNGVNHSHNDVGSFIVHRRGHILLTDPGAPVYRRETFSGDRYAITLCSALGHSVPVINGVLQPAGAASAGTLTVDGLNAEAGPKVARLDLTRAYPPGTVASFVRTLTVDPGRHTLTLVDTFVFDAPPATLVEAFVTFEPVTVTDEAGAVVIGTGDAAARLEAAGVPGRFAVTPLPETARETRDGQTLKRITFEPKTLASTMALSFRLVPFEAP
jgi:hypothetical protein